MSVSERVLLVTGGGQGIGRAFALGFAREGYGVVIADRNATTAAAVAQEVARAGGRASAIETDVSSRVGCVRMAEHAKKEFGRIDVLVNCAVVKASGRRKFWEIDESEWDRLMAVNVKGVWLAMCSVVPAMREQGGGTIVNMASAVFNAGQIDFLHYVATKAAVIGITRSAARELGEFNIRVNCILPGYVETATESADLRPDPARLAQRMQSQIIKRPADPDDVVGVGLFLASEQSKYMTGQSINIDGGRTFI
jgi:3-oxoacyl-[acyl-carrier protein] reductase